MGPIRSRVPVGPPAPCNLELLENSGFCESWIDFADNMERDLLVVLTHGSPLSLFSNFSKKLLLTIIGPHQ
jgi:hypothetical protein